MSPTDNVHLLTRANTLLTFRREGCTTVLHWLPSHAGVQGNDDAGAEVKLAALLPPPFISLTDVSLSSLKVRLRSTPFNHLQVDLSDWVDRNSPNAKWYLTTTLGRNTLPTPIGARRELSTVTGWTTSAPLNSTVTMSS